MFEQSLVTSTVSGGPGLSRKGSIVAVSMGVQAGLVAAFLVMPLIWPETLPKSMLTPRMTSVSLSKPVVKVQPKPQVVQAANSSAMQMPARAVEMVARGGTITRSTTAPVGEDPPVSFDGIRMGGGNGPLAGLEVGVGTGSGVRVSAAPAKATEAYRVSQGVMVGLLLAPIQPVYPRIAQIARQEGTVVVTATIDKDGRIVGAKATSGPMMLQGAAVGAVKEARYRPFLLNGEPTDVVTTITVNFRLGA